MNNTKDVKKITRDSINEFITNVKFVLNNKSNVENSNEFSKRISVYEFIWDDKHPKFDKIELYKMSSGEKIFLVHNRLDESNYDWSGFLYIKNNELHVNYKIFKDLRGFKYSYTYEYDYARFSQTHKEFCDLANIEPDINW